MKTLGGGASAPQSNMTTSRTEVPPPKCCDVKGDGASAPQSNMAISGTKVPPPGKHANLPHIDLKGYYQFITFRTHDSIDDFLKRLSSQNNMSSNMKQYKIDTYLDTSKKGCYLNNDILQFLKEFFLKYDKKLYELIALSVMPNHIHILFKQKVELSKILQQIKGSSSFQINKILGIKGQFWEDGYYDKLIRDENHFSTTYEYIKFNAVKAGLDDAKERFYGIYEV